MISVTIDGVVQEAQASERLIDVVKQINLECGDLSPLWSMAACRHAAAGSTCLVESFYSPSLRLVAADQSADRSDALQRGRGHGEIIW